MGTRECLFGEFGDFYGLKLEVPFALCENLFAVGFAPEDTTTDVWATPRFCGVGTPLTAFLGVEVGTVGTEVLLAFST